jgi:hypothetical protein
MLAKRVEDRFENAEAVLDAIDAVWTQNALQAAA